MIGEIVRTAFLVSLLAGMIRVATPILFASLGELVTERSGILNLGVEGTMLMGAFAGFMTAHATQSLGLGVAAAMGGGGALGLLMVFCSKTLRIDQKVAGLTMNLLSSGLTAYGYRIAFREVRSGNLPTIPIFQALKIPGLSRIPVLGEIFFSQFPLTYLVFLLAPLIWVFLYRTQQGLQLRCVGHNPRAMDMRGVDIRRYQYLSVVFGGMMAGLGGAFLTLSSVGMFLPDIVGGRGWIAIALVIFGDWKPFRIVLAALFFGLLDSFQLQMQGVGFEFAYQLLLAVPYVLTIVALVLGRHRSGAPLSLGVSYNRE